MIDRILTLVLLVVAALLPRMARLRPLRPARRLYLICGATLLGLIILRPMQGVITESLASGTALPLPLVLLATIGSAVATFAIALVWSAVLDDTRRGWAYVAVIGLGTLGLLFGIFGLGLWPFVALPLALRTGWARGLDRRWHTITAALVGFAALLAWPRIAPGPASWPPACHAGLALARLALVFLAIQLAVISVRLIFGVMFGPRRIGRRLLVSHLVIGILPVALTGFFVVVTALLAIASLRASLAARLLYNQHAVSQALLAAHVRGEPGELGEPQATAAMMTQRDAEESWLADLALRIGRRWGAIEAWRPLPDSSAIARDPEAARPARFFVAISTFDAMPAAPRATLLAELNASPEVDAGGAAGQRGRIKGWMLAHRDDGETRRWGDASGLTLLPPPQAWALRPPRPGGIGLIKSRGVTLHVAEVVTGESAGARGTALRVQVIEELQRGHTRGLHDLLSGAARIEERMRFALSGGSGFAFSTDTLAVANAEAGRVSSYGSSYELAPAQEWSPDGGWQEIYLSILGLAGFRDLMPSFPRVQENPLALLPVIILLSAACLFVLVETAALISVVRTGREIGNAVTLLRGGTERLQRGDLAYRIPIQGSDELSELGEAFNEMAQGLEAGRRHALERERLEGELELARKIQQRLLPEHPPVVPCCSLAGVSVPARQVGGDYYDFICLPNGRLLFVMADVSGKGAPAALLMSSVRAALHSMPTGREGPAEIVARLNAFVLTSTSVSEFVTLFLGLLDGRTGELIYVNAGHEQPFLILPDRRLERLTAGGLLMGAFAHATYEDATTRLAPGATLFLYTDGLSDATNPAEEMFSEERIERALAAGFGAEPKQLLAAVLAEVNAFTGEGEPADDITLVAIRRELSPPGSV